MSILRTKINILVACSTSVYFYYSSVAHMEHFMCQCIAIQMLYCNLTKCRFNILRRGFNLLSYRARRPALYRNTTIKYIKNKFRRICLLLRFLLFIAFHKLKRESTIPDGYRKWGTHARVFFPNTRAWELQEWNKIKKQTKNVRRDAWVWKEAKRERKKKVPTAYHNLIKIQ